MKSQRGGKYTGSLPSKGNICFVNHCRSRLLQKLSVRLSYFKIPKHNVRAKEHEKWKENLKIKQNVVTLLRICELHFSPDCFLRDLEAELTGRPVRKRLKEDAVPTIYLSKAENFVPDLQDESVESIKKSDILTNLAKELRQFRDCKQTNQIQINKVGQRFTDHNSHEKERIIATKNIPNNIEENGDKFC